MNTTGIIVKAQKEALEKGFIYYNLKSYSSR